MQKVAERIKFIRGKLNREEFAQTIGVHKNTLGRYERGESEPELSVITQICLKFSVDPHWLLFGNGAEPRITDATTEFLKEPITTDKPYYVDFLDAYNELRKQNSYLWPKVESLTKENGELKLEIERLKNTLRMASDE